MAFFPDDFDPADPVLGLLDLCELDTPDGTFRFMIGADGVFTDVTGARWWGSQLASVSALPSALNGVAPTGALTLSYFQDPSTPDLIADIRSLGVDYISGREIRFLVQPFRTMAELSAPVLLPQLWLTRVMRGLTFSASGPLERSITLSFDAWTEDRKAARRIQLNTEGHAALAGAANQSLEFMPTVDFDEEKLFG